MTHFSTQITRENSITLISQASSVVGIGGIGKTELCRQFVCNYKQKKPNVNVIWLNADNEGTINTCFKNLARLLYVQVLTNEGEERDINTIVQEIFRELNESECIFIYDNCDNPELLHNERYLPSYMGRHLHSRILITSRNNNWSYVHKICVDRLKLEDAINLVNKQLGQAHEGESTKKLVELLECFPLALQQAIAYIIKENLSSPYTINDYLSDYSTKKKKLLQSDRFQGLDCRYSKTTYTTWRVTIDKLRDDKTLDDAGVMVLSIISYLDPETIQKSLFDNFQEEQFEKSLRHCVAYSLLVYDRDTNSISIHRLLQQVIRLEHQAAKDETKIIRKALQLVQKNEKSRTPLHATSVWRYASHHPDIIHEFYERAIYSEKKFAPLHLLALDGDIDAMQSIIHFFRSNEISKSVINATDGFGRSAVFIAASLGHCKIVEALISAEADTNTKSTICYSSFDELKTNIYDPTKWNPLHVAAYYGHVEVIKVLISANPPLVDDHDSREQTPPLIAAIVGNIEAVEIMKGDNPLLSICAQMTNVIKGHSEILKLEDRLQKLNKPETVLNNKLVVHDKWVGLDLTLVRIAAQAKADVEIFKLLQQYGAKLFRYNGDYRELLHFCGTTNNGPLATFWTKLGIRI